MQRRLFAQICGPFHHSLVPQILSLVGRRQSGLHGAITKHFHVISRQGRVIGHATGCHRHELHSACLPVNIEQGSFCSTSLWL